VTYLFIKYSVESLIINKKSISHNSVPVNNKRDPCPRMT